MLLSPRGSQWACGVVECELERVQEAPSPRGGLQATAAAPTPVTVTAATATQGHGQHGQPPHFQYFAALEMFGSFAAMNCCASVSQQPSTSRSNIITSHSTSMYSRSRFRQPTLQNLPSDCTTKIFSYLTLEELCRLKPCSKHLRSSAFRSLRSSRTAICPQRSCTKLNMDNEFCLGHLDFTGFIYLDCPSDWW